jgi:probable sporulation protein (polysaccharide deacetylase family)
MRKKRTRIAVCLLLLAGVLSGVSSAAAESQEGNGWRTQVEQWAKKLNRPPVDARIDRVWKAIPALNGLEVDVAATLKRLASTNASPMHSGKIPLVVRQIPPKVSLDDLGPVPIYRGNPGKKEIALMVNVAWGTEYLPEMLMLFQQHHVKATFFLDGKWAAENPELASRIVREGHEVGNHAYNHPDMAKLGRESAQKILAKTNRLIHNATGKMPVLFAPPGGSYRQETVEAAHRLGMKTILWTLDTVDWKRPPAEQIYHRIVPRVKEGYLILMHPTAPTVEALRTMIPALRNAGFSLVTVSTLISPTITPEW